MELPEITLDIDAILLEIDKDITVDVSKDITGGFVDLGYDVPELAEYRAANTGSNVYVFLPAICRNTPEEIQQAKLKIASTVAFIRQEGVEAYFALFTSGTPS